MPLIFIQVPFPILTDCPILFGNSNSQGHPKNKSLQLNLTQILWHVLNIIFVKMSFELDIGPASNTEIHVCWNTS